MFIPKLFKSKEKNLVNSWSGQLLLVFIGTTVSFVLTLAFAKFVEMRERRENQRLSAMMVMSNIEIFARTMDGRSERMAVNDSIATWLLSKPIEELELLTEKELDNLVRRATDIQFLSHDKSAENIFTNNIETWKNIGNVQFVDLVGQCFSAMNTVEEYWNKWVNVMDEAFHEINYHPEDYEGSTIPAKYIRSEKLHGILQDVHYRKGWLSYVAATMRYYNRRNMEAIGITEEEILAFTNDREKGVENEKPVPRATDYYLPTISPDSLITFRKFDRLIDSLKGI